MYSSHEGADSEVVSPDELLPEAPDSEPLLSLDEPASATAPPQAGSVANHSYGGYSGSYGPGAPQVTLSKLCAVWFVCMYCLS